MPRIPNIFMECNIVHRIVCVRWARFSDLKIGGEKCLGDITKGGRK